MVDDQVIWVAIMGIILVAGGMLKLHYYINDKRKNH